MSRSQDQTEELTLLAGGHLPKPSNGPSAALLQSFPNTYPGHPYVIHLAFPEFTSLCPVTGQPDFGTIIVDYIPDEKCVESKSFKLYMFAFRDHHSFMETMTNKILEDLITVLDPNWLRVQGLFVPRGGITLHVFSQRYKELKGQRDKQIRETVTQYYQASH